MADRDFELGSAELEVLRALWENGPSTVRHVLNHLHGHRRKLAYTTVLTFLTRLEQKGYVVSDKSEVAYVYRATLSRDRIRRSKLKNLVQELYDGVPGSLVLQLIRTQKFTREEIVELQELIDRLDAKIKRPRS